MKTTVLTADDTPMVRVSNTYTDQPHSKVSQWVHVVLPKEYWPVPLDVEEDILLEPREAREVAAALIAAADEIEKVRK